MYGLSLAVTPLTFCEIQSIVCSKPLPGLPVGCVTPNFPSSKRLAQPAPASSPTIPCLVFACLCSFVCIFFGFRSGNTKLLMGSRTHQNASHLCLCSLSCHAGNTSPSIVLFANSDAFSKILLFRYLLLVFIHARSTSGSPMLFSPGITLYCNLFVYAARP